MATGSFFKADKSIGQHWLNDDNILDEIVYLADLNSSDHVLEIGPGTGNLTKKLIQKCSVMAVELDQKLYLKLKNLNLINLELINESILKFDFNIMPKQYKIVANIPYYLTSNLIRVLSSLDNKPQLIILLVQNEIATRLTAKPGQYSLLGLTAQFYFDIQEGPFVSRNAFYPIPKVDSKIIILKPKSKLLLADADSQKFFKLIKTGFASKRKTLFNNLRIVYKDQCSKLLDLGSIGVDPKMRAQELSLSTWLKIFNYLEKSSPPNIPQSSPLARAVSQHDFLI